MHYSIMPVSRYVADAQEDLLAREDGRRPALSCPELGVTTPQFARKLSPCLHEQFREPVRERRRGPSPCSDQKRQPLSRSFQPLVEHRFPRALLVLLLVLLAQLPSAREEVVAYSSVSLFR